MIIKRFTITSKLGTDIKSCTKNEEQTLELLKRVFGNDKRYEVGQELNLYWDIEDIVLFGRDKYEK